MQNIAHPFVKWAGGKTQLLPQIQKHYPHKIRKYCEPFVGGGAVLFDVLQKCQPEQVLINDVNAQLINTYSQIKNNCVNLIQELSELQQKYTKNSAEENKNFFLEKRARFNELKLHCAESENENLEKAALFIFLNKTCFNGLYRVNKKGEFNVPHNNAKNPLICDEENLKLCSSLLKNVQMTTGDYSTCRTFIDSDTFVYLDPPYRPLTQTAAFTSYSENNFGDREQIELGKFVEEISEKGAKILLSNSDPKNTNENDNFFDDLYSDFTIERISASRMINSNAKKRGAVSELLIENFKNPDYIPIAKFLNESLQKYGKIIHKFPIFKVKFDKNRLSYQNQVLDSTVNNIVYNFYSEGWEPIVLDNEYYLRDGQHRLAAARIMGLKYIDVIIYNVYLTGEAK